MKSGAKISGTHEGVLCACVGVCLCAPTIERIEHHIYVHNHMQVDAALCAD